MEILLFQARKEIKKSRWDGVIDKLDRKLRRGRAEIRDLATEQFKTLKGGKEQKTPSIQGRGSQDPGKEVTVWVAWGVENKGQAGGGALGRRAAAGIRADGLSRK